MNYTLDTGAIRKRFAEAIVGIREDGTMAVLVGDDSGFHLDLGTGITFEGYDLADEFPTIIRPGDRCEGEDSTGEVTGVYRGFSGDLTLPHCIQPSTYVCPVSDPTPPIYHLQSIRPLPEPVVEPPTCSECGDKLVKCVDLAAEIVSYYCPSCQRKNNLMTRLAAAERELAAIRAEMKGTQ